MIRAAGFVEENALLTFARLAGLVILRAWMAMSAALLQGSGRHVFLANVSTSRAVATVLLSVALVLVLVLGIVGVALGRLIPLTDGGGRHGI